MLYLWESRIWYWKRKCNGLEALLGWGFNWFGIWRFGKVETCGIFNFSWAFLEIYIWFSNTQPILLQNRLKLTYNRTTLIFFLNNSRYSFIRLPINRISCSSNLILSAWLHDEVIRFFRPLSKRIWNRLYSKRWFISSNRWPDPCIPQILIHRWTLRVINWVVKLRDHRSHPRHLSLPSLINLLLWRNLWYRLELLITKILIQCDSG